MSKMLEAVTAARESRDWSRVVEAIPYARYLALSVDHTESDFVCKLPFADRLIGNPGLPALHGGAIGALMESAAVLMLLSRMESIVLPKTITQTVD
jgi:acyl-coenzyme A thioesterase PaaI-like protein